MARRKRQGGVGCWSAASGQQGKKITVYERAPGGILWGRVFDPALKIQGKKCHYRRVSLGHRDKAAAQKWALAEAAKLADGLNTLRRSTPTVRWVFETYRLEASPDKAPKRQQFDRRCAAMWTRILRPDKDLSKLRLSEWKGFVRDRASGAINEHGHRVPADDRVPLRARPVVMDLDWLRAVIHWSQDWETEEGRYILDRDPTRGKLWKNPTGKEKGWRGVRGGVRRPFVTTDRYEALREVAPKVTTTVMQDGKRCWVSSYLTELLDLAWYTGRRITPILSLTYADLRLDTGPTGSIKWPGETDKNGEECMMDLHPVARAAIDRVLVARPPFRGQDAPLFPAVRNSSRPMDKSRASTWLRRAEKLAGLEPFEGSSWHAFRRGWATRHKHFPDVDVARAGGWKTTEVLKTIYQQATDEGVRTVLMADAELREAQ